MEQPFMAERPLERWLHLHRAELFDSDRGTSSYQRPIINVLLDDASYNGLWEVVEITVNDSEYKVDDVKSEDKLEEGLDDGRLTARHTGFVINCPVVDERTAVLPSANNTTVPRPRIEVWYRTKLGNCFLANGWESIGERTAVDADVFSRSCGVQFTRATRATRDATAALTKSARALFFC